MCLASCILAITQTLSLDKMQRFMVSHLLIPLKWRGLKVVPYQTPGSESRCQALSSVSDLCGGILWAVSRWLDPCYCWDIWCNIWYSIVLSDLLFLAVRGHYLYNILQVEKWQHVVNHFQTWDGTRALSSQLCPGSAALVFPLARSVASTEAKCRSIQSNLLCNTGQSFVWEENVKKIYHWRLESKFYLQGRGVISPDPVSISLGQAQRV